ncbi:hypothetical protein HHX47_DHR1000273 [Lentinula edodes]|nr:hypothetical protein HHX47_DHR1000273 [Lentinula edodes]
MSAEPNTVIDTVMIGISSLMFFIATWHLIMNAYRMVEGYVDYALAPGGAVAYIGNLVPWHHILKDTLYATQEILGSAAAIYRCWVLWGHNWKIILFPLTLLIVNTVAGYMVCGLYSKVSPTDTVFASSLTVWIKIFYTLAVVLNIITTSLMGYRIWSTHRTSARFASHRNHNNSSGGNNNSRLLPILRILVESAALQLIVEIVLLALYCEDINAQYILLESVASIVGITFNAITIRIKFQSIRSAASRNISSNGAMHTVGSMPMRHIQVNIAKDVEEGDDGLAYSKSNSEP